MKITTNLLKQLIREAMQDDLEFLRDVKYSDVDLEAYKKIIGMYQSAQQNNDTVTLQYIDSMHNIPRDKEAGKLFTFEDISLIDEWFEDLTYNDEAGSMGVVTRGDFARFIRLELQISREEAKVEADRLWPMALDYFEKEGKHNYSGTFGAPFDLEP